MRLAGTVLAPRPCMHSRHWLTPAALKAWVNGSKDSALRGAKAKRAFPRTALLRGIPCHSYSQQTGHPALLAHLPTSLTLPNAMKPTTASTRRLSALAVLATALLLGACASKGVSPVAELTTARSSISQAESAGALQLAPVEMLSARTKMSQADAAERDERYAESKRLAEQAAVDADVAERKSRAAKAARTAEELNRANTALEQEATRKR